MMRWRSWQPALAFFRELGDPRGEAAVLALQGRAAAQAGQVDAALASYRSSLARFRALGYTEAREQALYDLRTWRRQVGPGETSRQIGAILAEEPEKRYVARFPSSKIALLQVLSLAALPLTLLLTAIASPTQVLERLAGSQLVFAQTYYDPLLGFGTLLLLLALYAVAYTLVALVVIFFVPLNNLEREQPDYVITSPTEITHYDNTGALAQRLRWDAIQALVALRSAAVAAPAAAVLGHAAHGRRRARPVDRSDHRLVHQLAGGYRPAPGCRRQPNHQRGARAANPAQRQRRAAGDRRGAAAAVYRRAKPVGRVAVCAAAERLRGAGGAGIQRRADPDPDGLLAGDSPTGLDARIPAGWSLAVGCRRTVGLAAVLLFVVGGGEALPVPALNVGLLIWGAYLLADALATMLPPRLRAAPAAADRGRARALFQQNLGFLDQDGRRVRYDTIYSNQYPAPPRIQGGEGRPMGCE